MGMDGTFTMSADILVLATLCGAMVKFVLYPLIYPALVALGVPPQLEEDNRFKTSVSIALSLLVSLVVCVVGGISARPDGLTATLWLMLGTSLIAIGQHHLLKNLIGESR
jgi:hypothetical protein